MSIVAGMNNRIINLIVLIATFANASAASKEMLHAVAKIESSDNPKAIGDGGLARGLYQMHKPAWEQISTSRKARGEQTWGWSYAHDRHISGIYASEYLDWLAESLKKRLCRIPEPWEVYAAYNRGLNGFKKLDYSFDNLPSHTKRSCLILKKLSQYSTPKG
jgi:soluble lytic murein transglycosylase-like protein